MNDKIEQQITIDASPTTVWSVLTDPKYISKWFSEKAEIDLKKGGRGKLSWESLGDAPLEVIEVNEPHLFSFAWVSPDKETQSANQQTLVEFKLTKDGDSTLLHISEIVYGEQKFSDEQKTSLFAKHTSGWEFFAGRLKQQAEEL